MDSNASYIRRRLDLIAYSFARLVALLTPEDRRGSSQRMCPFCGRITSRYQPYCLECGEFLERSPSH